MILRPRSPASAARRGKFGAVGVEDGAAARRQQLDKQPILRRAVGLHVAVVVEMVARQIGEGGGGEFDTVEAELGKPVARRLDRGMATRFAARSLSMRCNATGSGVVSAPGRRPLRRPSQACQGSRIVAERLPDLAGEMGDRGLAVGAGDRGDRFWRSG